jgi:hypothetical protein
VRFAVFADSVSFATSAFFGIFSIFVDIVEFILFYK